MKCYAFRLILGVEDIVECRLWVDIRENLCEELIEELYKTFGQS